MPAIAHENKILGNVNTLNDLTDVDLTSPQNGQVPIYNSTTQKWENGNQSGGAEIDDTTTSTTKVWSSSKTNTELSAKANASEVIKWSEATTSVKKNLLENKGTAQTIVGVSFTINDNKSIELNGTATNNNSNFVVNSYTIPAGQYILSKTGTSDVAFQVADDPVTRELYKATTSNVVMTFAQDTAIKVRVSLVSGKTYNNTTIYPMIRHASIEDDTYEPYIPDNTELMRYTDNAVLGAKNLLPNNATSQTVNGVTLTKNADGTVTANGTATSVGFEYVVHNYQLKAGTYKISKGEPTDITIQLVLDDMSNNRIATVIQDREVTFTLSVDTYVKCYIWFSKSAVFNNYVYKPMLRLATDTDDTYVPYAMTNRELTEIASTTETIPTQNLTSVEYSKATKIGNLLSICMRGITTNLTSSGMVIGMLPQRFRPSTVYFGAGWDSGIQLNWQVWNTGEIKVFLTTTGTYSNYINLNLTLIL